MLLMAFTHLNIGLSLDTSLAMNVEKYLMCLVGTRRPNGIIKEQQSILFLKTLIFKIRHQASVASRRVFQSVSMSTCHRSYRKTQIG
jgi:hypothetical protein